MNANTAEKKTLEKKILLPYMNPAVVSSEIEDFIVQETKHRSGGVIGLSGGVDSTTTAALATRAYDQYNAEHRGNPLELMGFILPTKLNDPKDAADGIKVAQKLGIRYEVQSIEKAVEGFRETNPECFEDTPESRYHKGNLISEVRATVLHRKGAFLNKEVIGTGNKDEDFSIGYYTLFGDGAVDLSPIGLLSKRLVKEMARYIGFSEIADRTPTAGLEPGQTDFKDLGYSYETVELVMEGIRQGYSRIELPQLPQIIEITKKDMEDYQMLFGRKKFNEASEITSDILDFRHLRANRKARKVHPPIAQITLEYG